MIQSSEKRTKQQFKVYYKDGYAVLVVSPLKKNMQAVYIEDVLNRLKILKIKGARRLVISDILSRASGQAEKICPWPEGKIKSAIIKIQISEDFMKAELILSPPSPGGESIKKEHILEELKNKKITRNIDFDKIESIIDKKVYRTPVIVAEGIYAQNARSPRVQYHFLTDRGHPFEELAYGRINLKELNFIQNRKKDNLLAELIPASIPIDGFDIFGNTISAKSDVNPVVFKAGENCYFSEDKTKIFALTEGNAVLKKGAVTIEPLIQVENVDYSNGNMDFLGSILVKGNTADGFSIQSSGDIQIGKCVGKSTINAKRNLILKAGINGNNEGIIKSGQDIYARFIESSRVECLGNLFVEEAIMNSELIVTGDILLTGRRAEIIGGNIVCGGSIYCKKMGTTSEIPTLVSAGISPIKIHELQEQSKKVTKLQLDLDENDKRILQLKNTYQTAQVSILKDRIKTAIAQLTTVSTTINQQIGDNLRVLHNLRNKLIPNETARVSVEEMIYPGTVISLGIHEFRPSGQGTSATTLYVKKGTLVEKSYQPLNSEKE